MNEANGIGVMSGTSLDGVDIALCNFYREQVNWKFKIIKTKTFTYTEHWKKTLADAHCFKTIEILKLHKEYGSYIGELINEFRNNICDKVDFIASHGHTIFHQPEEGITFQIGDRLVCIPSDFR